MKHILETMRSTNIIEDCRETIPNLATAFDVQDSVAEQLAAERGGVAGYKIAFNSPALLEALKLPHPGMGRIFADQVFETGHHVDVSTFIHFMIEPEIAARLSEDLVPGAHYSAENAESAVDRYFPAFELLDRRNAEGMMHPPTVIAHNVFNAGIVCGGPGLPPEKFDWRQMSTRCTDENSVVVEGRGIAPQAPAEALAFLANHYTGRGLVIPKGSLMLLGAHCPLYTVAAGRHLRLDMGDLGTVAFST